MLLYLPFAVLLLVVPDNRPPSRRWRFIAPAITSVVSAFILVRAILTYLEARTG